jgi:competence protein ComEC
LAIVVELPDERVFIIDGGKKQAGSTDRFDVGRDLIAPFLWQKRINKITAIIVSHPDADHANGIPFLIEHFQPDSIWTNSSAMKARETEGIRAIAQELAIPIKVPAQDETIYSQGAISLRAAGNLQGGGRELAKEMESEGRDTSENNQSLVLRLTIGNTVCLFPGDIEAKAESRLIREGVELQADILIAPHHGSKTSNSADFIRKVSPDYVVVSAGTKSEGKFPSAERMQTYRESGSTILTTAISGTVFFSITDTIEATTFY